MQDVPTHPDELTTAWLTATLRNAGALRAAHVMAFDSDLMSGARGAMGCIARVQLAYDCEEARAPRTLIAKFASQEPAMRALGNALRLYEREVGFYTSLAADVALRTPRCYFAHMDATNGTCLLLLEDLAPARNGDRIAGCSPAEAELALREAAKLHADWWQNERLLPLDWLQPFDTVALQEAYQRSWPTFVARMGSQLAHELRDLTKRLGDQLVDLFDRFWTSPWTLVHNDYHLDNFFFGESPAGSRLTVIDWHSTIRGRGALDVANLLGGNLAIEHRRAHESALIKQYHNLLIERGVQGYSFERCFDDYRAALLDGLSRLVIALASDLREEQERAHREVLWPRFSSAVLDLNVGEFLA